MDSRRWTGAAAGVLPRPDPEGAVVSAFVGRRAPCAGHGAKSCSSCSGAAWFRGRPESGSLGWQLAPDGVFREVIGLNRAVSIG